MRAPLLALWALTAPVALGATYDFVIDKARVQVAAKSSTSITVNGTLPGPVLRFREGEETHLAVSIQGLAPHLLEADVAAFVSHRGDVALRAEQTVDLLLTQRLA
jgi:uncharacterized protein involved in copper resistance